MTKVLEQNATFAPVAADTDELRGASPSFESVYPVLAGEATSGHNCFMTQTGIRDLKDNLSHYVRRVEAGERVAVTAHGRVVAELVPPSSSRAGGPETRLGKLVAAGLADPPSEQGDPTEGWPALRLPAGTSAALIDSDRGE
jgi:prevent-host-death family protein